MLRIRSERIDTIIASNLCTQRDNADDTEERAQENKEGPRNVANGAPREGRYCCLYQQCLQEKYERASCKT